MLGVRYRGVGVGDLDAGDEAVSDLRCDGVFKAKPCGKLIGQTDGFIGNLTVKCPKCNTMLRFAHMPRPRVEVVALQR